MRVKTNGRANGSRYLLHTDRPLPVKYEKYPFGKMARDKDKMFYLHSSDKPKNVFSAACVYAGNHGHKIKFTVRFDPDENKYGCWRVK